MTYIEMFEGMVNSPQTELSSSINATDTLITVVDSSVLPSAPNLATIGTDQTAETIKYTQINGSQLTVFRGFEGTAKNWDAGEIVARQFTNYDQHSIKNNINELINATNSYSSALTTAWTDVAPYTQQVDVAGILQTDNPIVDILDPTIETLKEWSKVSKIETFDDHIIATCFEEKPTTAINIQLKVVK